MCGIFGVINSGKTNVVSNQICSMFRDGLIVSSLRGVDSTGLIQIRKDRYYTYKSVDNPVSFLEKEDARGLVRNADDATFTVAHSRAATTGGISLAAAQPFLYAKDDNKDYIIGVHNGTIRGWKQNDYGRKFVTDSEWALATIQEKGLSAFELFDGAFCFVYYTSDDPDSLHIIRNHERPMFVAFTKTGRAVFASEHRMLSLVAERNDVELDLDIIDITPGRLYKFSLSEPKKFSSVPVKFRPVASSAYSSSYGANARSEKDRMFDKLDAIFPLTKTKVSAKKTTAQQNIVVYSGEKSAAERLKLLGKKVIFTPMQYSPASLELDGFCSVEIDGKEEECGVIVRTVGVPQGDSLLEANCVRGSIIGFSEEGGWRTLIVSPRKLKRYFSVNAVPKSELEKPAEDVEDEVTEPSFPGLDELEQHIKDAVQNYQSANKIIH